MMPLPHLRDPIWFPVQQFCFQEHSLAEREKAYETLVQSITNSEPSHPNIGFPKEMPEEMKVLANESMSRDPTDPYLSVDAEIDEESG